MVRAYLTVEASLVVTLVIYVYVFIIFMAFFQYDRCLLTQDSYILAMRGSREKYADSNEIYGQLKRERFEMNTEKYLAFSWNETSIEVKESNIAVNQGGSVKTPIMANTFMLPEIWQINIAKESARISPVTLIRRYRLLKDLAGGK